MGAATRAAAQRSRERQEREQQQLRKDGERLASMSARASAARSAVALATASGSSDTGMVHNREGKHPSEVMQSSGGFASVSAAAASSLGGGQEGNQFVRYDRSGLKGKRGRAKKGGGGHGKFTWGLPGDEIMDEPAMSKEDPNYDSQDEQDEGKLLFSVQDVQELIAKRAGISTSGLQGGGHLFGSPATQVLGESPEKLPAKIPLPEFKRKAITVMDEYFTSEDMEELKDAVVELHSPMLHYELVRRGVSLAMERNSRERELLSVALSELHGARILSSAQCEKGFERLFEIADDLVLDIPPAKKLLSQFVARAVADEILAPSFLADPLIQHIGAEVVENAKVLLSIKHGLVRLEHVWGTSSSSSVKELKQEIKMLLQEFTNSSDLDEACECVKRLNVPHFHHEVVKRAIVLSLDCREREQAMMSSLFAELSSRGIVSQKQMEIGFRRLYEALPDLELDAPGAAKIVDVFLLQAIKDKCVLESVAREISSEYHETLANPPAGEGA